MKVLLLNPPARDNKKFIREGRCTQEQGVWATLWPPISLVMIGAVLEKDGHDVKIFDCPAEGITEAELIEKTAGFSPGIVIWSTGTPSIQSDLSLSSEIKKVKPGIFTAVFGTHVTELDQQCMLQSPHLDFIIRNEPEITIKELVRTLDEGKKPDQVEGITLRNSHGKVIANPARPFIEKIDSLPFPAWHLININSYTLPLKGRKFLIVAPQRGCPFNCSFCTCQTYYGNTLRKRSVENIIEEIEYDISKFSIKDFFFWAETFVVNKNHVKHLCEAIIKKGFDISWTCNSRVDIVDKDLLQLMAQAGCWMISFGIESGEQKVLDNTCKGTRVEQTYDAVKMARQAGIKTTGHFIFGLPGETMQSMEKTIKLSATLGLDIAQFYSAVPFPGSRLYRQAEKEGWIKNCAFGGLRQDSAAMELPTVSPQAVNQCRSQAYRNFYFKPSTWLRILGMTEYRGLKMFWKAARTFLNWSG